MNKFKDVMHRWRTISLFKETARQKGYVLFTFEEARSLYMDCNDPTGYKFATNHLGGWQHWLTVRDSPMLIERIESWEEELQIKLRSDSVKNMIDLASGEKGYQASKFLIDGGWLKKGAGRPTKASVQKAIKQKVDEYTEFDNVLDIGRGGD